MPVPATVTEFRSSTVGYIGHQVHVVRRREAAWLLDALGEVEGKTILDVAGGDGYWAAQVAKRGAYAVGIDVAMVKLERGRTLPDPPGLVRGDALRLPFPSGSVDGAMSMCAIEHFDDASAALAEMARVIRPGGVLAMSADALTDENDWPDLSRGHREAFFVVETFSQAKLARALDAAGFDVERSEHMFRSRWTQGLYLRLHRWRYAPNALAPLGPLVAMSDRHSKDSGGAILVVQARRR